MNNKPLLSIAIPTYNRVVYLENLLNHIVPQAKELEGMVEICISNNGSPDNTREIAMIFKKKYPDLIKYNENKKNLGFDRNVLKVIEMAQGDFVWLLGDNDLVVDNGFKKVMNLIKRYCNKDTGFVTFASISYFVDNKTGKKMVYSYTIEKNKPKVYKISPKDIIGQCFPCSIFISVLLFNNNFLKKILKEEKETIEKAVGNQYIHTFLYRIMFLKYPNLKALRFNEIIIDEELPCYKFYIEDVFQLHYIVLRKLDDLLLSSKYMNDYYRKIIINNEGGRMKSVIVEMGVMKSFKALNYSSFFGCLKMFFQQATFMRALLFSAFFTIFSIIPAVVLKNLYKIFIKIKHKKEWQKFWFSVIIKNSEMSKGSRRLIP